MHYSETLGEIFCCLQKLAVRIKKRNFQIALRLPEGLSRAMVEAFNKDRVNMFFSDVEKIFASINVKDYLSLFTNCDETVLSSVPNSSNKVFAVKRTK